jgi:hypothetical protein
MNLCVILLLFLSTITIAQQNDHQKGTDLKGVGGCTFSYAELLHLGHGHDLNSGKMKLGDKLAQGLKSGSGCSPEWAMGKAQETFTRVWHRPQETLAHAWNRHAYS